MIRVDTLDRIENLRDNGIKVGAYKRVSTDRQVKEGRSLEAQEGRLRELAKSLGASTIYWFVDAGKTGTEFDKRKLNRIMELRKKGEISELLVTDIDRIGRECRKTLLFFLEFCDEGGVIRTPEGKYDPNDLSSLLKLIVEAYTAQQSNESRTKASIASRVHSFERNCWNKPVPKGYQKRADGWIEKAPGWPPVTRDVFQFFLEFRNIRAAKDAVNRKHRELLPEPLSRNQVRQMLQNPIYIGKPEYSSEAVKRVLGRKAVVEDSSLAYVDRETFGRVQKVLDRIRRRHSHKRRDALRDLVSEYGPEVIESIPDVAILCPDCKGVKAICPKCGEELDEVNAVMVKNGGKVIVGEQMAQNYICRKCGRQRKFPTKADTKRVEEWISRRRGQEKSRNPQRISSSKTKSQSLYDFLPSGEQRGVHDGTEHDSGGSREDD